MTLPLHQPWPHHILDSIEEVHALLIGVALGIGVGIALRYGAQELATYAIGIISGMFFVLWWDGALVYWPAHGHAWYIVAPAILVAAAVPPLIAGGGLLAAVIRRRRRDPQRGDTA